MAANTLNILTPSVNNLSARIFVRAAGLDFEEKDVWGVSTGPEYIAKYPPHLTPSIEAQGLPRATYPTLGFPQYGGEVATSEASGELKAQAQRDAIAALAEPLEVYNTFFLAGKRFIGGEQPSIADIRLAATLEFLRAIDYNLPAWAEEFMAGVGQAL